MKKASQTNHSLTTRIYSRQLFETEFAHALGDATDMSLSGTDMNILLSYLSRDKPILSTSGSTIKFKAPEEATPSPITEQDANIASLRDLITTMTTQVAALTSRITSLDLSVREAVAKKQTHTAKSSLRSKKLAENTLTQRTATLAQLEEVYTSIENAADQVAVVRVMESSSSVLSGLHKQVGGIEGVEGVVDKLREEMENVDEVGRIINEGSAGRIDEGEVDDELAEMERVEREKVEAVERAERERKEAEEAEVTKRRLEELEKLEQERKKVEEDKAADETVVNGDRAIEDAAEAS